MHIRRRPLWVPAVCKSVVLLSQRCQDKKGCNVEGSQRGSRTHFMLTLTVM